MYSFPDRDPGAAVIMPIRTRRPLVGVWIAVPWDLAQRLTVPPVIPAAHVLDRVAASRISRVSSPEVLRLIPMT